MPTGDPYYPPYTNEVVRDAEAFFRALKRTQIELLAADQRAEVAIAALRKVQALGHTEAGCPLHYDCPELPMTCPWSDMMDMIDATLAELDKGDV